MRKIKWKNLITLVIFIVCFIILCISIYNIISWYIDNNNTNNEIEEINKNVTINEVKDTDDTQIIQNSDIDESDPYWDYIKMNLIDVDFEELKNTNNEVKGWIKVNGTNINYPFVQAPDNDFYLTHSFDKKKNTAGWVFLDYRNAVENFNKNTILYAHGRVDKTMFGSLKNILKSNWYNDSNNYVIKLSTEYENMLWQVFSVYRIPTTNDYLQIEFTNNDEFYTFANKLKERSNFNFNTSVNKEDKILTLSTCYNKTDKVVMHAKLIKIEKK